MNSRMLSYIATALFIFLGTLFIFLRYHSRQVAQSAREDSRWRLTYDVEFEASAPGEELRLAYPFDTRYSEVVEEKITNPGLRNEIRPPYKWSRTRDILIPARQAATYRVTADFELKMSPRANSDRQPQMEFLSQAARDSYLRAEENIPVFSEEVVNTAQQIPDDVSDAERLQWIFQHCSDLGEGSSDDADVALENEKGTALAKARAMAALCRAIKIPARLVTGFEIKQTSDAKPHVWVEVYQNQMWIPFDPVNGYTFTMPMQYVPVRRGGDTVEGDDTTATIKSQKFSIMRIEPPQSALETELRHPIQILSLTRLPQPMHKVVKILLLLPYGALLTSIIRNVVGIRTFGTFSPALLAMSFIYADWETGLMILLLVGSAGLVGRTLLERLRLLMVPRLSIILTVVILCVVFGVSLLDWLALTPSAEAVLLPMVILTTLIERFYVTTEEDGLMFTIQLALGTLMVAVLCYLVLRWDEVGRFVLVYPEAHCFTIAAFIILGRYAGYRLTELWRFRDLVDMSETPS